MPSRRDMGSWLEGGVPADEDAAVHRPGTPERGAGARAPLGRRVVALVVDWAVASLVAYLVTSPASYLELSSVLTLGIFALENVLLVSLVGYTIGHRLMGLRVQVLGAPADMWVGFVRGAVRTVLLCLVIPAVVWGSDGRGLHDRAAGTEIVRR